MSEIYSNDNVKIIKDNSKSIFRIELAYPNAILLNSLVKTRIIQGGTIKSLHQFQEDKNKTHGTSRLSINETALLIANLSTQLKYIITKESHTILGYAPENIIVIDDKKFAFLGSDLFSEIENNKMLISYPFSTNDFFVSPELLKIKELPSYIHYKTAYFSLGCLAINVLLSDDDFYREYINNESSMSILHSLNMHPIKNTKLYWLLSRCLVEEPEKRSILFL